MPYRPLLAAVASVLVAIGPSALAQETESGLASIYADDLEGRLTASGQTYTGGRLTAAHRTLPFGTRLRVTDPASGQSVTVLINDRWGGGPGKVVNLSRRAAEELGMGTDFERKVELQVLVLGDGGRLATSEEGPESVFREPLAPRFEPAPNDPAGPRLRCRNEAEILGLRDHWAERHVRTCLARQPLKKR
ncbi:MAG TPA: septal ring lytic transglycosylase RlpA family protein [Burkholderiales bacterium]|nr:septal ring lytic transglycosylase RlpA family protein [Burkholderiales bacterium]